MVMPNKSLQATRDGALSSASRFTRFGPACLSSSRSAAAIFQPLIDTNEHEFRKGIWLGLSAMSLRSLSSSFVSICVHSWLDRLFHMNTTIAEPGCSSERAGRALVPCWAPLTARH